MDHIKIGRRLVRLPGVRIEFGGEANTANHMSGLSRGETHFVSVGVDSPEAESFSHYLTNPGNLLPEAEEDLSYYNSCAWGEATTTLYEQRALVLRRFGPTLALGLRVESVFQPPDSGLNVAVVLNYRVTVWRGEQRIVTTECRLSPAHIPGWVCSAGPTGISPSALSKVLQTGRGGLRAGWGGILEYEPGPAILPSSDYVLLYLTRVAATLRYASFEDWTRGTGLTRDDPEARAIYTAYREVGTCLRESLGQDWIHALANWEIEQP